MPHRPRRSAVVALAAAVALAASPAAAARQRSCLTRAQLGTLTHVLFPVVVDGALTRCAQVLPPDAYLVRAAASLRAAFPVTTVSDPAAIRHLIEDIVGDTLPGATDDAAVASMFTGTMVDKLGLGRLTAGQCRDASEIVEPLAALPPAEFERLIVAVLAVAGRGSRDLAVCEAAVPARR